VKVGANLFLLLGAFVLGAGAVYGLWGHELAGTFYLCVLGVAFMYLSHVLRLAAAAEPRETEEDAPSGVGGPTPGSREDLTPEPVAAHASAPSLTPFFMAIAIGLVVLGLVFSGWLALLAAAAGAVVLFAWYLESAPRRAAEHAAAEHAAHLLHESQASHAHDASGDGSHAAPADGSGDATDGTEATAEAPEGGAPTPDGDAVAADQDASAQQ
jgi:hypothetical protein